jgi:hypothetical protein
MAYLGPGGGAELAKDLRWWKLEDGKRLDQVLGRVVTLLREQQRWRRDAYLHFARLYAGPQVSGLGMLRAATIQAPFKVNTLAFNIIASVCNTVQAKIAKNRPLPKFLTNGGDWSQQRKAKMLSKFIEGEFDRCDVWQTMPQVVLDACVFGEGVVKIYQDGERLHVEREFPWRVMQDEVEGQYGYRSVRSCYQRKPIDRLVLAEMFPEHASYIRDEAKNDPEEDEPGLEATADQLVVTEAWHLPSGKGAKDGRRAICIHGKTLLEEEYERDYFPFVWLRRNDPLMGTHSIGFAEALCGLQYEINFTARRIQEGHYRQGGSHWAVEKGSNVQIKDLNNGIATLLYYTRTPPVPQVVRPVHPDQYQYLAMLIAKGYEMEGVSQLSASAKKPAGLDSGAAIREYNDIESEGFVVFAKQHENAHVEIAKQMADLLRELVEQNKDYAVQVRGKRFLKTIKFTDVNLEPDAYVVECFPTSLLPHTPAGRLAQVEALVKGGIISDPKEARRLLAFPDLEASNNHANAPHELVEEILERMLDDGIYEYPEPLLDLVDCLHTGLVTYQQAKIDQAPEEVLDLLRSWIADCKHELDLANPPPAPAAPMGPEGMPPGMPPPGMEGPPPMPPPPGMAPPLAA